MLVINDQPGVTNDNGEYRREQQVDPEVRPAVSNTQMWIRVDGPYGKQHFNYRRYPVLVLVCGGIGVTPVIGILKDIYGVGDLTDDQRMHPKAHCVEKVYVCWVVSNYHQYQWFQEELNMCVASDEVSKQGGVSRPQLQIDVQITQGEPPHSKKQGGALNFIKGRPDMSAYLNVVRKSHDEKAACVFACGPRKLVNRAWDAAGACSRDGAKFTFHHETFEF